MATQPKARLTVDEYLEQEQAAEFRSEYYSGQIFAMAGTTRRHALIVTNISSELRTALRNKDCNVYTTDVRLGVPNADLYAYPDLMVTCGREEVRDKTSETLINPILIVEVLSDSTKDYDRGGKFQHYRSISSLETFLTIAQDEVHVEHYQRRENGWFLTEHSELTSSMSLPSIGIELRIAGLYEKVRFSETT